MRQSYIMDGPDAFSPPIMPPVYEQGSTREETHGAILSLLLKTVDLELAARPAETWEKIEEINRRIGDLFGIKEENEEAAPE